jgi:hypothetical protein
MIDLDTPAACSEKQKRQAQEIETKMKNLNIL